MSTPYALHQSRAVLASAGTGKTYTLVETYVGLLVGIRPRAPVAPSSILALTFTDRAASEMRARVLARLQALSTPGAARDAWLQHLGGQAVLTSTGELAQLQPQVLGAPIGTFHAFCARLLHEHASLHGHGLAGTILDDAAARTLLHESALEAITAAMETDARHEMLALLQDMGSTAQWGLLAQVVALRSGLGEHGVALDALELARLPTAPFETARVDVPKAVRALPLARFTTPSAREKVAQLLELTTAAENAAGDDALLHALAGLHATASGNWGGPAATDARAHIKQVTAHAVSGWAAREAVLGAQRFKGLLLQTEAAYAARKAELGAMDFQDLLTRARDLLRAHPLVAARLATRYQALLVDEMQDTSPLQAQLLALLLDTSNTPSTRLLDIPVLPGRLLVVGDRKQSIYGFRGAEVALLDHARQAVERHGGDTLLLSASRRSSATLVPVLNRLCQVALADQWLPQDALSTVRDDGAATPGTWIQTTVPPGATQDEARLLEARNLAHVLARRVLDGTPPTDMVVLLRKRTHADVYRAALEACGVPARVGRGGDLLSRPEVQDAVALWAILLDPSDSHALATLLRSPLVMLRDDVLVALALRDGHARLDAASLLAAGPPADVEALMTPEERANLWRVRRMWEALSPHAAVADAGVLLNRALDALDAWAVVELAPDGAARAANLRALELLVTGRTTAEALHLVRECQRAGLGVPLGMPETMGQVAILTIHEAKGLEWPVVVLADMASGVGGAPGAAAWHPATGLAVRVVDHASGAIKQTHANHPLRVVQAARQADADEETRRLLYVALTRARDGLVFSGTTPPGRAADLDTFLARLQGALAQEVALGNVAVVLDPPAVRVPPPVVPVTSSPHRAQATATRRAAARTDRQLAFALEPVAPAGVLSLEDLLARRHPDAALPVAQRAPLEVTHARWGKPDAAAAATPRAGLREVVVQFHGHALARALALVPAAAILEDVPFALAQPEGLVTGVVPWLARGAAEEPWTLLDVVEGGTPQTRKTRLATLVAAVNASMTPGALRAIQGVASPDGPLEFVVEEFQGAALVVPR